MGDPWVPSGPVTYPPRAALCATPLSLPNSSTDASWDCQLNRLLHLNAVSASLGKKPKWKQSPRSLAASSRHESLPRPAMRGSHSQEVNKSEGPADSRQLSQPGPPPMRLRVHPPWTWPSTRSLGLEGLDLSRVRPTPTVTQS